MTRFGGGQWSCGRTAARRQGWNPASPGEPQAAPDSDRSPDLGKLRTALPADLAGNKAVTRRPAPYEDHLPPPFLALHQLRPPQQRPTLRASPLRFALLPPTPPSGSSKIGGVRAGARESPGRPLGWRPLGPGAVPGVVAAPTLPKRRPSLPVTSRLRHSRKE